MKFDAARYRADTALDAVKEAMEQYLELAKIAYDDHDDLVFFTNRAIDELTEMQALAVWEDPYKEEK